MAKPRATAQNAVTHGIFHQDLLPAAPTPFAALALTVLPGRFGKDMADDLMRAERQTARCRVAILDKSRALGALFDAPPFQGPDDQAEIETGLDKALHDTLRQLTRLLSYQNQSLTALRKTRIAILNAAEGLPSRRSTTRE